MIITLTPSNFTLVSGAYYSIPIKKDEQDTLISVSIILSGSGTTSLQGSIDGTNWADLANSSFACTPFGLQTYTNGDYNLLYRLKTDIIPTSAQISI